ncbi:MAG: hypothetical protein QNJ91_16375 [Gammaproteobacteria bacterium]|nr:hypothetical protein [Gammaproteobacteria bacterium]
MSRALPTLALCIAVGLALAGCTSTFPNRNPVGEAFPPVTGQSLAGAEQRLPQAFRGRPVVLLLGFVQDAQFDIDRWLIGLDMTATTVDVYEIPTIQGMLPRVFRTRIDDGMRAGIPQDLWQAVITVYDDGETVQAFTGNANPNNARALLLDDAGDVVFFHDAGFSVAALNALRQRLQGLQR